MATQKGMTLDEHAQTGENLKSVDTLLRNLQKTLMERYGVRGRKGKPAMHVGSAIASIKRAVGDLDVQCLTEHPADYTQGIYYHAAPEKE